MGTMAQALAAEVIIGFTEDRKLIKPHFSFGRIDIFFDNLIFVISDDFNRIQSNFDFLNDKHQIRS